MNKPKQHTKHTMRVPPEISARLIAFFGNDDKLGDISWDYPDYDTHTIFAGTAQAMNIVRAFVRGFQDGVECGKDKK